mmetsp:Transcript_40124/g.93197  ORF Transcript_40124/g.93197 Transcript_40124/m.93197 type:complete len:206 (-) Transcript_40124:17-634(-)
MKISFEVEDDAVEEGFAHAIDPVSSSVQALVTVVDGLEIVEADGVAWLELVREEALGLGKHVEEDVVDLQTINLPPLIPRRGWQLAVGVYCIGLVWVGLLWPQVGLFVLLHLLLLELFHVVVVVILLADHFHVNGLRPPLQLGLRHLHRLWRHSAAHEPHRLLRLQGQQLRKEGNCQQCQECGLSCPLAQDGRAKKDHRPRTWTR